MCPVVCTVLWFCCLFVCLLVGWLVGLIVCLLVCCRCRCVCVWLFFQLFNKCTTWFLIIDIRNVFVHLGPRNFIPFQLVLLLHPLATKEALARPLITSPLAARSSAMTPSSTLMAGVQGWLAWGYVRGDSTVEPTKNRVGSFTYEINWTSNC